MAQSETEHGKACAALPEKPIWKTAALGCPGASLPIFWHLHLNPPPPCSSTDSSWQVSLIYTQCGRQENFGPREHIFQTFCNSALGIPSSWQLLSLSLAIRSNLTAKRFGGELWSACYFFFFFLFPISLAPQNLKKAERFSAFSGDQGQSKHPVMASSAESPSRQNHGCYLTLLQRDQALSLQDGGNVVRSTAQTSPPHCR